MTGRFVLRPLAECELEEIADFIARSSPESAVRFVESAGEAFEMLANSPLLGELRPTRRPEYVGVRVWQVPGFRNYLIYYRTIGQAIEVLRIVHGARDQDAIV